MAAKSKERYHLFSFKAGVFSFVYHKLLVIRQHLLNFAHNHLKLINCKTEGSLLKYKWDFSPTP